MNASQAWAPLPAELLGEVGDAALTEVSATITDEGKVRIGAHSPMFVREDIADAGIVRLGAHSPVF